MPEANVNVTYEFEIDKEEMAMFLLNITFYRSVLDEEEFSYSYMQKIRINGKTFHIGNMPDFIWSCLMMMNVFVEYFFGLQNKISSFVCVVYLDIQIL